MSLNARHYSIQRQEDWQEDLYHLEIPTAWGALYNVWPGADIINHWSIKPGDHKMCPLWIHLQAFVLPQWVNRRWFQQNPNPTTTDSSLHSSKLLSASYCLQSFTHFGTIGEQETGEVQNKETGVIVWCIPQTRDKRTSPVLVHFLRKLKLWKTLEHRYINPSQCKTLEHRHINPSQCKTLENPRLNPSQPEGLRK